MKKWFGIIITMVTLAVAGPACKELNEEAGSEALTLDNFAAGSVVAHNKCSGTNRVSSNLFEEATWGEIQSAGSPTSGKVNASLLDSKLYIISDEGQKLTKAERGALEAAYSALPREAQDVWLALKGKFVVTANPAKECGEAFSKNKDEVSYMSDADRKKISSCWRVRKAFGKSWVEIILPKSQSGISFNLVRSFGYFISQHLLNLAATDSVLASLSNLPEPVKNDMRTLPVTYVARGQQIFTKLKQKLFEKFLEDAHGSDKFNLAKMGHIFGTQAAQKINDNVSKYAKQNGLPNYLNSYLENTNFHGDTNADRLIGRTYQIASFVFAEAFDSRYCSNESRQVFMESFSRSRQMWNPGADERNNSFKSDKFPGAAGAQEIVLAHLKDIAGKLRGNPNQTRPFEETRENILGERLSATTDHPALVNQNGGDKVGNVSDQIQTPQPTPQSITAQHQIKMMQMQQDYMATAFMAQSMAQFAANLGPALNGLGNRIAAANAAGAQPDQLSPAGMSQCPCGKCANGKCCCNCGACGPGGCGCAACQTA